MPIRPRRSMLWAAMIASLAGLVPSASCQSLPGPEESDPVRMGWMVGFPPPPDRRIMPTDPEAFAFPKLRWSVCHMRELMPTVRVSRGSGPVSDLPVRLDPGIDAIEFTPLGSVETITWDRFLSDTYTDGIIVLHRGAIVYERYAGCLDASGVHAAMSVTKSFSGLLAEILIAEGKLDEHASAAELIPELAGSAFESATVRQILDMTTALDFSENYADPDADIWAYNAAVSPLTPPTDPALPQGYFEYLTTIQSSGPHGSAFGYKTVNTDALGWILARTTGRSVAELLSERIWSRIGAEQDAYFSVDRTGTPFAGGGLSASLRDLARFGLLVHQKGSFAAEQVFPAEAVERITRGGSAEAFEKVGFATLPGASYRSMWWIFHDEHACFAARGVHGQTIYIDPAADMVLVRLASHPVATNAANDPVSLPAYRALADYLMAK